MKNIFFLILLFITGNIYAQSWNPITGKTSFTDSVRYLRYRGTNNNDSVLMIHPTTGVLIKTVKGLTPSLGIDSITLYGNQLCQWQAGIATCYFLTPSTGGAVDSFHLSPDSLAIYQYRNGAFVDSIYLLHTYLYVDPVHFTLTPNYLSNPYAQFLDGNKIVDSVYASPFGTPFNYISYANGNIDSVAASGGSGGSSWNLLGNLGTDATVNFVGTTDGQALTFKTNSVQSGQLGFGVSANTSLGYISFLDNISGINNTAIGGNALRRNTTGSANVSIGAYSMWQNLDGSYNMSIGGLGTNVSGSQNAAVGINALGFSLGSNNIGIGFEAGQNANLVDPLSNSERNIFIGTQTKALADGDFNEVVLGDTTTGHGSNTITVGNRANDSTFIGGYGHGAVLETPSYILGTDSRGKIVEVSTGGIIGGGLANFYLKDSTFSDSRRSEIIGGNSLNFIGGNTGTPLDSISLFLTTAGSSYLCRFLPNGENAFQLNTDNIFMRSHDAINGKGGDFIIDGFDAQDGATYVDYDVANPTGIKYLADYSATYTNRSLVDKAFIESHVVESGGILTVKPIDDLSHVIMGFGAMVLDAPAGAELDGVLTYLTPPTGAPTDSVLTWNAANGAVNKRPASSFGGITTLNTLTGTTQTFATGTVGTDFGISSSGTTHTFNIPSSSASNRGVLTSADWSTFNGKQAALNGTGLLSFSGTTPAYNTTSASIAAIISDEVGTDKMVFNTAPTFVTSITDPLVIGGNGTTSTLTLQSTSGSGTTGSDIIFKDNNTEFVRFLNNGNVGIGQTAPLSVLGIAGSISMGSFSAVAAPANGILTGFAGGSTQAVVGAYVTARYFASTADTRASALFHSLSSAGVDQMVFAVSGDGGSNATPAGYAQAKMVLMANGRLGIGNTDPTAVLHIKAGTASAGTAPQKYTSGTNLTTPEAGAEEYDATERYSTNSTAVRGTYLVVRLNSSSAGTLTLATTYTHYVFTGTTTTWTLPAVSGTTSHVFYIKNRGSGAITLGTAAAANELYTTSAVNTLTINAGEAYMLLSDGTYFNVE